MGRLAAKKKKLGPAEPNMRSARVTLTQTRGGGLNKRVRMQRGIDHTANKVASCSKPFKTQLHPVRSTAHDANMFLSPFQDSTQHPSGTVQRQFTTNSNIVIGRGWSKFHTSSDLPVRVPRSCHCPRHRKRKSNERFCLATTYEMVFTSCTA